MTSNSSRTATQKVGLAGIMLAMTIWTGYQAQTAIAVANTVAATQQCSYHCGPEIAIGEDGQPIDCTVTDKYGDRMDWHQECDLYWAMAT